jgi:hypothetical protein
VGTTFCDFTDYTACRQEKEDCMLSKCEHCANVYLMGKYSLNDEQLKKRVKWERWNTVTQQVVVQEVDRTGGKS